MIGFVKGILDEISGNQVIIDVNGIGCVVNVGSGTISEIGGLGDEVRLYTYMSVKEDDISLFGFLHKDELELFKLMIKVSGIGPKGALAILSVMSVSDLRFAILTGDSKSISRAPGIGGKTAQKLILELKDKISDVIESQEITSGGVGSFNPAIQQDERTEAAEALMALGYSSQEAYRAVKSVDVKEGDDANAILKSALKFL